MLKSIIFLLLFVSCASPEKKSQSSAFDWKKESKKLSHEYAKSMAHLSPEGIASIGFNQFEHLTTPFSKDLAHERYVLNYKWKTRLEKMLGSEKDKELRTDIKILLDNVNSGMEYYELSRKEGIISFYPVTEMIFNSVNSLMRKDATERMKKNALTRFRTYVRGDEEQLPMVDGVMAQMVNEMNHLATLRKRGFWPTRTEVETYLAESDNYISAIDELLQTTKTDGWQRDLEELKEQNLVYLDFVRKKILPYARKNNVIPFEIFSYTLKDMGIEENPRNLIETAKKDYRSTYLEFTQLAHEIAAKNKLSKNDPVSVVKFLTDKKISNNDELLKLYVQVNDELFQLMKKHDLLTIKEKPDVIIRFASKAEAQSLPAPYFNNSPFFGKDKDRPSEFVITPSEGGRDDFSFKEAVITLTAHEAMPGHALQYHMMKERGTTLMRSWMAFNSVNVEGWGLYAEDLVYPYLTKEAQFITLQRRLWRQARMFLDPELNLGLIKGERVLEVFMKELGFSKLFAQSELTRYSWLMPGQANSYYYGYKKLMGMKKKISNQKCFNDAVLNFGILPLDEINARLEKLNCEGPSHAVSF